MTTRGGRAPSPDLTQSERQIAELVASGRTDRDAAEARYLSPRAGSANLARQLRRAVRHLPRELAARSRKDLPVEQRRRLNAAG